MHEENKTAQLSINRWLDKPLDIRVTVLVGNKNE